MADNNGVQEQGAEELNAEQEEEAQTGETPEGEAEESSGESTEHDPADDEVVITIGEEAPPHNEEDSQPAPAWVKDLRKADREKAKRIRELEQEKAALMAPQQAEPALGPEPTLEDSEYDPDVFKAKYKTWLANKQSADNKAEKQKQEMAEQQKAYQARLATYSTAKAALKVPDYEEAEDAFTQGTSTTQQGIIVSGADDAAKVIYYLGKNPAKLNELASIKDPVKYAFAVAKLETQLKVTPRKAPPTPEKVVRGSATAVGINDPKLERLEAEAERTGDRSKIFAYNREQKLKQRQA